jgi:hypothetical protein
MSSNDRQRNAEASARYALPAIVMGITLFGLSFLPIFASGRERWTKDQALELQQASMRIQELTHKLGAQTPDTVNRQTSQDYQQALDHFANMQSQLKEAQSRSGSLEAVLRILGLLLAIGGAVSFFATKRKSGDLRPIHTARTP